MFRDLGRREARHDARQAEQSDRHRYPYRVLKLLPNTQLLVEQHSDDPPRIIALHGWARTKDDWRTTLAGLPAISLDLPGFGSADAPHEAWGTEQYAQYLLPLLTAIDHPILLGHSFGGRIAAQLTAIMPEKVSHLVLTGAPLRPKGNGASKQSPRGYRMVKWLNQLNLMSDRRVEQARMRYGSPDYKAANGVMRTILVRTVNENYDSAIRSIADARVPVHLIWGADDTEVPPSIAETVAGLIPGATMLVVPGAGHPLAGHLATAIRSTVSSLLQEA